MAWLAFYKGKGTWIDRLVRLVTRSEYSHVELIATEFEGFDQPYDCYSSSPRDGGVRVKNMVLRSGHWTAVHIGWLPDYVAGIFVQNEGSKYDYFGLIFSQLFNFRRQNKQRWFCSELIAAVFGFPVPASYSPGSLKITAEMLNLAFLFGYESGRDVSI